jgi:hypothetical protein
LAFMRGKQQSSSVIKHGVEGLAAANLALTIRQLIIIGLVSCE